jgi:hypothetical protein
MKTPQSYLCKPATHHGTTRLIVAIIPIVLLVKVPVLPFPITVFVVPHPPISN